jgi:hypothetical protein
MDTVPSGHHTWAELLRSTGLRHPRRRWAVSGMPSARMTRPRRDRRTRPATNVASIVRLEPVSNFEVGPFGKRETGSDTNHVGDTSGSPRVGAMGGGDSTSRVVWVAAIASATDSS